MYSNGWFHGFKSKRRVIKGLYDWNLDFNSSIYYSISIPEIDFHALKGWNLPFNFSKGAEISLFSLSCSWYCTSSSTPWSLWILISHEHLACYLPEFLFVFSLSACLFSIDFSAVRGWEWDFCILIKIWKLLLLFV